MILEHLGEVRSLALVGIGKNVGKTTALNVVVAESSQKKLGLTSIGRDGELVDAITAHTKPPIRVPAGTLVATVEGAMPGLAEAWEIVERTDELTPLGPIVIGRALREVQWEISGPSTVSGLERVRTSFQAHGADFVIIDGAFDRRSSAAPLLSDVTLLVSGASVDPDIEKVVGLTAHMVDLLTLPAAELPGEALELLRERQVGYLAEEVVKLPMRSALGRDRELAAAVPDDARAVLIGTALTPQLLEALERKAALVVVRDPTHALVDPAPLQRFRARGGRLQVGFPVTLPLVIANPFSPYGWRFDPARFLDRLSAVVAPRPVVDLVLGETVRC